MNFEFSDPIPLVQQKKKYSTFTITPIGGSEEIVKWREMQAAKEMAYRMRLNARDGRISEYEALSGQKLDTPQVKTADWQEKVSFALMERKRLAEAEARVTEYPPWEIAPESKKTIIQKIVGFFKQIWVNSNL